MGEELKQARIARGLSLESAGGAARISQGYLHKLDAGRVNNPSPRVLRRLSEVLDLPYRRLMELADYLMPDDAPPMDPTDRSKEAEPMAAERQAHSPTNAELLRQLEAVRGELMELKLGQQQLARTLEQLTGRAE